MRYYITAVVIIIGLSGILSPQTIVFTKKKNESLSVSPGFIIPSGKLGEMSEPGPGVSLVYTHGNLFFSNAFAGLETGCYYLPGKETSEDAGRELDRTLIAPMLVNFGYRFFPSHHVSIAPSVSAGAAYFSSSYSAKEGMTIDDADGSESFFDGNIKTDINITYRFENSFIGLGAGYGAFIEQDYINGYFTGRVIFGYRY